LNGDLVRARGYAERSLEFRAAHGLPGARALTSLAELALEEGELARARQLLEQAADEYKHRGHEINYVWSLEGLAEVARRDGQLDRATELLADALRRANALGDPAVVGEVLEALAVVAGECGQSEVAGTLWGAGGALRRGATRSRRRSEPYAPVEAKAAGAAMKLDEAVAYALRSIDEAVRPALTDID
jgi:tetratricopeptide (TPR) repeat protein